MKNTVKEKPIFIYSGDLDASIEFLSKGYNSIAYSLDSDMLAKAYRNDLKRIRKNFNN